MISYFIVFGFPARDSILVIRPCMPVIRVLGKVYRCLFKLMVRLRLDERVTVVVLICRCRTIQWAITIPAPAAQGQRGNVVGNIAALQAPALPVLETGMIQHK